MCCFRKYVNVRAHAHAARARFARAPAHPAYATAPSEVHCAVRDQDAAAIGTIGFFWGWFNAFNGPFVAHWADSGLLNRRVPFFASWGRRRL